MSGRPQRLFVAAYPPEQSRRQMLEALGSIEPPPDSRSRLVPVSQLHMTLQFIGETDARHLDDVTESVRRSVAGLGRLSVTPLRLITLPEKGVPRLIAMETDAPGVLIEAHRRLAMRLAKSPRAKAADRFLPHLTLCRFAGDATPSRVDLPVSLPPFEIAAVSLMCSVLKSGGAEHVLIAECGL